MAHDHDHGHGLSEDDEARGRVADRAMRRLLLLIALPLLVATLVGLVVLRPTEAVRVPASMGETETYKATVLGARLEGCPEDQGGPDAICQRVDVQLDEGPDVGAPVVLVFGDIANPGIPRLERDDRIVLTKFEAEGQVRYSFADHQRGRPIAWLAAAFALLVVVLARWKGVAALAGLGVTLAVLLRFVLPAIVQGRNPVAVCVVAASAVMFVVFFATFGINVRSVAALTGTVLSLGVTGILAAISVGATRLTGAGSEESLTVNALASQVDLRGLLLGGMIIGALGVLNDVTITQASTVWQLRLTDSSLDGMSLYRRAMRVGRDHIGATVDTLVLAYAGAALPLLILFSLSDRPFGSVLTSTVVAEEVVRSLVGAIGLMLSVPITTAITAALAVRAEIPDHVDGSPRRSPVRRWLEGRYGDPFARRAG